MMTPELMHFMHLHMSVFRKVSVVFNSEIQRGIAKPIAGTIKITKIATKRADKS